MESLFARATSVETLDYLLPSGQSIVIRRLCVRFGTASPDRLREGALLSSYTDKPLVTFNGAAMFGELAVLRWLEVDGWDGVWLDTIHGRKAWRDMPTRSAPVSLPPRAQSLYGEILTANDGRASGMFDVMAWRGAQTIFVEYEEPGEPEKKTMRRWIDAALVAGVSPNDLLVVTSG